MTNVHTFADNNLVEYLTVVADQASANTSWVQPFDDANRAVFMLVTGALSAEEIDFKLTQATDSSGTSAKDITSASITQITTSTDEVVVTIEIGPGALDDANGFNHVRGEVTVDNSGTELYGVVLIKHRLRYPGLATQTQDSSYAESVTVLTQ